MKSPLLLGGIAAFTFYALIYVGILSGGEIERYFAMHPVEYVIGTMFFVGVAALVLKYFDTAFQKTIFRLGAILPPRGEQQEISDVRHLLAAVNEHEQKYGLSYYSKRLRSVLESVQRSGSAEKLDDDLRYWAEEDAIRADAEYGLVRMILWAVPMLGFLGTVIGIALALGNLSPDAIEKSLPLVMSGLTIAFDTTALAIALDIVLFFAQFMCAREENKLLYAVDQLVDSELRGRFEVLNVSSSDAGAIIAVRKMLESVVTSVEQLIKKQSQIWDEAINVVNTRAAKLALESAVQLKTGLLAAVQEGIDLHSQGLAESTQTFVQALQQTQHEMTQQSHVLHDVISAASEISSLETQLNKNLTALAGAAHFEETVNSLAAAIHLLNSRHLSGTDEPSVQLWRKSA